MKRLFSKTKKQEVRRPIANQPLRPAFSYYSGDKPKENDALRERQQTEKKQQRHSKLRSVPTLLALCVIALSLIYSTTLSTNPSVVFAGSQSMYKTKQEYSRGIEKILQEKLLNRSKLTIDSTQAETAILRIFPEVDAVKLTLPVLGTRPTVTIHVREPALVLTTTTNAFVVDDNGRVVSDANSLASSEREKIMTIQDQSGVEIKVGDQALTTDTVAFIRVAQAQFVDKKLIVSQAVLPKVPNELDFRFNGVGYYVKTDITGDARLQIGSFIAAKESGVVPSEYMDVRVEEKVFYK